MSGGISAIKGFDYQATVILDKLFDHFDRHELAQARPEGIDDLDLSWVEGSICHRQFVQIKKPTEDTHGNLNPTAWTLSAVVKELLPSAIKHLSGNRYRQLWVAGDSFDEAVITLINAGQAAPELVPLSYWRVVHALARNETLRVKSVTPELRKPLLLCKAPSTLSSDPVDVKTELVTAFRRCVKNLGAGSNSDIVDDYAAKVSVLHHDLPDVLARIEIQAIYGSEYEVVQRVYAQLTNRYSLPETVIEHTLFRNLRGFINDISKQQGRCFDLNELEVELRCVWPQMIPVKDFPVLGSDHVTRRDLVDLFTKGWTGKAIETIGISGSGKTMLTADIAAQLRKTSPDRRAYYAEVRSTVGLRDILVGVAYHLRRQGIPGPFELAIRHNTSDEGVLAELARAYSALPHEMLLLIDLVEGSCNSAFSRDIATFIRSLSSSACQVAVFGQESALRELTKLEREEHHVSRIDVRGFSFDEFLKLVACYHRNPDQLILSRVYDRVTVGRAAGLFARLAQVLASADTIDDMLAIAARPAEDILAHAEHQRFGLLSAGARGAAEKIVCFALPFSRKEAEDIFPEENIGAAMRELLTQGLLREHDNDTFEMHETVRAGLEQLLAPCIRRSAHRALARRYHAQGLVTTEIFHLEKAGLLEDAYARARALFLSGEHWSAVSAYVLRHHLISAQDVLDVLASPQNIEHIFMLGDLLRTLQAPDPVSMLLHIIQAQKSRYYIDYRWRAEIVETILEWDPVQLNALIVFTMDSAFSDQLVASALRSLGVSVLRKGGDVTSDTLALFREQPPEMQAILADILLRNKRRSALQAVFTFLLTRQPAPDDQNGRTVNHFTISIDSLHDAIEFLAAIPPAEIPTILASKSLLPGPIARLAWPQRVKLRVFCIEVLSDHTGEERVIENAIRVLIFLGEPSLLKLCEPFQNSEGRLRAIVTLCPILQPALIEPGRFEAQFFDIELPEVERMTALQILAATGVDLGPFYRRLKAVLATPEQQRFWEKAFLLLASQYPFPEVIALFEAHMNAPGKVSPIFAVTLYKLGSLPGADATALLIRALNHKQPDIRCIAALSLSYRRSRIALPALVQQYAKEEIRPVAETMAQAIIASGAQSLDVLHGNHSSLKIQLCQCILAMRLRDVTAANWLVRTAVDPQNHWQLRRAAIFAAGSLPFDAALDRIIPEIMTGSSALTLDHNDQLGCHSLMSSYLIDDQNWYMIYIRGRKFFVDLYGSVFDEGWATWYEGDRQGLPSGEEAAGWLFDRLSYHGAPHKREAVQHVINELHFPLLQRAAIRALRLCGLPEQIEQQLVMSKQEWHAMTCLTERRRASKIDLSQRSHLLNLLDVSPCRGNKSLIRYINTLENRPAVVPTKQSVQMTPAKCIQPTELLSYENAVRVLTGLEPHFVLSSPLRLEGISAEQCQHLIRLADPINDPFDGVENHIPMIKFTPDGHLVAQHQWTSKGHRESLNAQIRPAIAAANSFGLPIPWLAELMTRSWSSYFVTAYLTCLGALNDSARFYDELSKYEDVLIVHLCEKNHFEPVSMYLDARMVPVLLRYVFAGTDVLFEGLCRLASFIHTPEVEPVLRHLLSRWALSFDRKSREPQPDNGPSLSRGFRLLTEHSRFRYLKDWISILEQVLQTDITWFHAQSIVRVLECDPRAYSLIELRLLKEENWLHFREEEIDRLDEAADRLFGRLSDN